MPSWTGFNIKTRDQVPISENVIGYLPTINAPATELTTVYEILKQSELIRKELLLETIVVVMDQALFAKATEIAWKHTDKFSNIILRMGTFHTICNALSILGKRFQDAGLKDICIEAGLVAEGSVGGVLNGKHYNHSLRTHRYIYEALMRLVWTEFTEWVKANLQKDCAVIKTVLAQINNIVGDLKQETVDGLLFNPLLPELISLWQDFLKHLHHNNGELSASACFS